MSTNLPSLGRIQHSPAETQIDRHKMTAAINIGNSYHDLYKYAVTKKRVPRVSNKSKTKLHGDNNPTKIDAKNLQKPY